jgi:hypothetical protein
MSPTSAGIIALPHPRGTKLDHGAFESNSRRVFVAHTARDSVEVIDVHAGGLIATRAGFPEAAGVAASERHRGGIAAWHAIGGPVVPLVQS